MCSSTHIHIIQVLRAERLDLERVKQNKKFSAGYDDHSAPSYRFPRGS